MPEDARLTAEREAFELAAFNQRFMSSIVRNKNVPKPRISGALDFVSEDCPMMADFVAKNEDGSYKEDSLNPAWWAWQKRASLSTPAVAVPEEVGEVVELLREYPLFMRNGATWVQGGQPDPLCSAAATLLQSTAEALARMTKERDDARFDRDVYRKHYESETSKRGAAEKALEEARGHIRELLTSYAAELPYRRSFHERLEAAEALSSRQGEVLKLYEALVRDTQGALATYIVPDSGISDHEVIGQILGLLDGPRWREARDARALVQPEGGEK